MVWSCSFPSFDRTPYPPNCPQHHGFVSKPSFPRPVFSDETQHHLFFNFLLKAHRLWYEAIRPNNLRSSPPFLLITFLLPNRTFPIQAVFFFRTSPFESPYAPRLMPPSYQVSFFLHISFSPRPYCAVFFSGHLPPAASPLQWFRTILRL